MKQLYSLYHQLALKHNPLLSQNAYQHALKIGPSLSTRNTAALHPQWALQYALNVDKNFHLTTFNAVKNNPILRQLYIDNVPNTPAKLQDAFVPHLYPNSQQLLRTCYVKLFKSQTPSFDTIHFLINNRHIPLKPSTSSNHLTNLSNINAKSAINAYKFAAKYGPSNLSRSAAAKDPFIAILYAKNIDKASHPTTRKGAAQNPYTAIQYAINIDKAPHLITRRAAHSNPISANIYWEHPKLDNFNTQFKPREL